MQIHCEYQRNIVAWDIKLIFQETNLIIFYQNKKWGQIFVFDKMMYMNLSYFSDLKVPTLKESACHIFNMMYFLCSRYQ
jgi:hypothetical protein